MSVGTGAGVAASPAVGPTATAFGTQPPRPGWLWPVRLVGSMIALLMVAGGAASAIGKFFERTTSATVTMKSAQVQHVVIDADHGDVSVRAGEPGDDVVLVTRETHAFGDTKVSHELVAGTLMIKGRCAGGIHLGDDCSTDLDLQIPEGVSIELSTDMGQITVDGMAAQVRATSGLGKITLRHLRSAQVEAAADLGELRAEFDLPPASARLRTDTGAITVVVPDDGTSYRVLAEAAASARIEVPQSPASTHVIVATAGLGSIRVLPRG